MFYLNLEFVYGLALVDVCLHAVHYVDQVQKLLMSFILFYLLFYLSYLLTLVNALILQVHVHVCMLLQVWVTFTFHVM